MDNPQIKTLELLKDWSTWLVAIDTGALALVGSLAEWHDRRAELLAAVGLARFLVSLLIASMLVGAIPVLTERLMLQAPQERDTGWVKVNGKTRVYQCEYGLLRVQTYAFLQHASFAVAAVLLTIAVLIEMIG